MSEALTEMLRLCPRELSTLDRVLSLATKKLHMCRRRNAIRRERMMNMMNSAKSLNMVVLDHLRLLIVILLL